MEVRDVRGRIDFGIITIREDEFVAVLDRFPEDLGIVSGRREYNLRRIAPDDPYTSAIVRCAVQGNSEAQQVANALLDDLEPRWLLVVGIAGGAPEFEFTLGDVVVATEVCDFNVGAALKDGSREYALHGWHSHPAVAKLVANLPAMGKQLGAWNAAESVRCERPTMKISPKSLYGDAAWKKKVRTALQHHRSLGRQEPRVKAGGIACSDLVMKDAELFQVWTKFTRQVIAVEMESAGVHKAAQDRHVPFMSIRGLSDIVGFSRDPRWTAYACHSAAAFTRAFLLTRPIPTSATDERTRKSTDSVETEADRKYKLDRQNWIYDQPERTEASKRYQRSLYLQPAAGVTAEEYQAQLEQIKQEQVDAKAALDDVDRKFGAEYDAAPGRLRDDPIHRNIVSQLARTYSSLFSVAYHNMRRVYEADPFDPYEAGNLGLLQIANRLARLQELANLSATVLRPDITSSVLIFLQNAEVAFAKLQFFTEILNADKRVFDFIGSAPHPEMRHLDAIVGQLRTEYSGIFSNNDIVLQKLPTLAEIERVWSKAREVTGRICFEPERYKHVTDRTPYVLDVSHLRRLPTSGLRDGAGVLVHNHL